MSMRIPGGDKVFGWATKMDAGGNPDEWVFKYKESGMQDFSLILPDFDPVGKKVKKEESTTTSNETSSNASSSTDTQFSNYTSSLEKIVSNLEQTYTKQIESLMQLLAGDPEPDVPKVDTASGLYGLEDTRKVKTQLTDQDLYKSSLFNLSTRAPASGYPVVDPRTGTTYANAAMARSAGITNWVYKYAWDLNKSTA